MRDNAANMQKLIAEKKKQAPQNMTAVDDLETYQKFAQAHVDGLKNLTSAFKSLYGTMSDQQKKNADQVFANFGRAGCEQAAKLTTTLRITEFCNDLESALHAAGRRLASGAGDFRGLCSRYRSRRPARGGTTRQTTAGTTAGAAATATRRRWSTAARTPMATIRRRWPTARASASTCRASASASARYLGG